MAHASEIQQALAMYTKNFACEERWKNYTHFLYTRDTEANGITHVLYGRLCFSQQLRFFVALRVENDSYIRVKFWREDPQEVGERLGTASFGFPLLQAMSVFPEIHETEFYVDRRQGWCMKNMVQV